MPEERKILCDVDGVTADFIASIIRASGTEKKREDFTAWNIQETLSEEEWKRAKLAMESPTFWLNLPLIDGAKSKVRILKARGFEFVWVTSPWPSCVEWDAARRFWIRENFGGEDSVRIGSDKEHVNGDFFIDDKPENVEKWQKAHRDKRALIFDAPYNQGYNLVPRVTWDIIEWFI